MLLGKRPVDRFSSSPKILKILTLKTRRCPTANQMRRCRYVTHWPPSAYVYVVVVQNILYSYIASKVYFVVHNSCRYFFPWHDSSSKTESWPRMLESHIMSKMRARRTPCQLQVISMNRQIEGERTIERTDLFPSSFVPSKHPQAKTRSVCRSFGHLGSIFYTVILLTWRFSFLFRSGIGHIPEGYHHTSRTATRRYILYYLDNKSKLGLQKML